MAKTGGSFGGYCQYHRDRYSIVNAIFQIGLETVRGGSTMMFMSQDEAEAYMAPVLDVAHKHLRQIVGPFMTAHHGARDWEGWRACIGGELLVSVFSRWTRCNGVSLCFIFLGTAYTDYRVLHFFHSFKLMSVGGVSRFVPRRREEVKRLWERYYETRPSYAKV